jgi:hypothetical protein
MEIETQANGNQHKKQKTVTNETSSKTNTNQVDYNGTLALKIHHCKFFDWMPSMISSMAFSTNNKFLAVGFQNGNIEIRTQQNNWFVERVRLHFKK